MHPAIYMAAARKIQRVFRARQKITMPGFISHVTQRASGGEPLFLEDGDYLAMLTLFKEAAGKFDLHFYAFCFMPNHIHALIRTRKENLAEAMQNVFSRYAVIFNRKYQRRGHLFGGPYRQAVCLDNTYLLTASVYIHLNPVRAGLTNKAVDYKWSSCRLYTRDHTPSAFVDPLPVLALLCEDPQTARKQYSLILGKGRDAQPENALEQEGAVERFCLRLAELFPAFFKKIAGKGSAAPREDVQLPDMTEIEDLLRKHQTGNLGPKTPHARKYLVEQLVARGYRREEIASRLGVSRKTFYNDADG